MKSVKNIAVIWCLLLFLVTFTCALTYLVAQQSLRLGADEQPAELAANIAVKLDRGESIQTAFPDSKIDIAQSMTSFLMVYDNNKKLLSSTAMIGGNEPAYPQGVLEHTSEKGDNRVTWQPRAGLRFATVTVKTGSGYIVAGRSLHETERLIESIGKIVLLAWITCVICMSLGLLILQTFMKRFIRFEIKTKEDD